MRLRAAAIALGALCMAQVTVAVWLRQPRALMGPTVGQPLPERGPWRDTGTCTVVAFISVTCPACQRMRDSWGERLRAWRDSVGAPVRVLWLGSADSTTLARFVASYDLDSTTVEPLNGDPERLGRRLGIMATPTIYLLDHAAVYRVGVLGDELPPADSGRAACRASRS